MNHAPLKRTERQALHDHRCERDERPQDTNYQDIEIALSVRRTAHGKQRHHGVPRQDLSGSLS